MVWQFNINAIKYCNLRCEHCYISPLVLSDKNKKMSEDTFILSINKIVDFVKEKQQSSTRIHVLGGEPLLLGEKFWSNVLPKTREILNENKISSKIKVATNLIIKKDLSYLDLFDDISTSWDVNRFETKKIEQLWEENVKNLISQNKEIELEVTITKRLVAEDLEKLLDKFLMLGFKSIHFNSFIERPWVNNEKESNLFISNEEITNFLIKLTNLKIKLMQQNIELNISPIDGIVNTLKNEKINPLFLPSEFHCPIHNGMINIEYNSEVSNCCTNDGLNMLPEVSGNLEHQSLNKISQNIIFFKRIREAKFPKKNCLTCEYYKICHGGCSLMHRYWNGDGECPANKEFIIYIKKNLHHFFV